MTTAIWGISARQHIPLSDKFAEEQTNEDGTLTSIETNMFNCKTYFEQIIQQMFDLAIVWSEELYKAPKSA